MLHCHYRTITAWGVLLLLICIYIYIKIYLFIYVYGAKMGSYLHSLVLEYTLFGCMALRDGALSFSVQIFCLVGVPDFRAQGFEFSIDLLLGDTGVSK